MKEGAGQVVICLQLSNVQEPTAAEIFVYLFFEETEITANSTLHNETTMYRNILPKHTV